MDAVDPKTSKRDDLGDKTSVEVDPDASDTNEPLRDRRRFNGMGPTSSLPVRVDISTDDDGSSPHGKSALSRDDFRRLNVCLSMTSRDDFRRGSCRGDGTGDLPAGLVATAAPTDVSVLKLYNGIRCYVKKQKLN